MRVTKLKLYWQRAFNSCNYRSRGCQQLYVKQVFTSISINVVHQLVYVPCATIFTVVLDRKRTELHIEFCVCVVSSYVEVQRIQLRGDQSALGLANALSQLWIQESKGEINTTKFNMPHLLGRGPRMLQKLQIQLVHVYLGYTTCQNTSVLASLKSKHIRYMLSPPADTKSKVQPINVN